VSNLIITASDTPGYFLPGGSALSASLLMDPRPQADCVRLAWGPKSAAKHVKFVQSFEQHVRPMVAEGTTGIPPSAYRDVLD
jgi:hypothetical protein